MLPVAEALAIIFAHTQPGPTERVTVSPNLLHRVLSSDILANADSPPFTKSLRDGYALCFADINHGIHDFTVVGEIPAGSAAEITIQSGEAVRIFTGAQLPTNADTVVMQEDCTRTGDLLHIPAGVTRKQFVLSKGNEYEQGTMVLAAGTVITPQIVGMMATLGIVETDCYPQPRVAVLSTGTEIVEAGKPLQTGQIWNSNGPMLCSQILRANGTPQYLGIAADDPNQLKASVQQGLNDADIVLISGGVSVGDYDHLPSVLDEIGVQTRFHQVAMKPGKPLLFGTWNEKLIFGLPGNPMSSYTCFELFTRPAMERFAGYERSTLPWLNIPLQIDLDTTNDRPTFLPARIIGEHGYQRVIVNPQINSANVLSLVAADAFVRIPAGRVKLDAGFPVSTLFLNR